MQYIQLLTLLNILFVGNNQIEPTLWLNKSQIKAGFYN